MWVSDADHADLQHNEYVFGKGFWTATMDAAWVTPGLTVEFHQPSTGLVGTLNDVEVGGLTELMITCLDVRAPSLDPGTCSPARALPLQ